MSLKINRHIVPEHWMLSAEVQTLFSCLQGNIPSETPVALFVGGCVRDVILEYDFDDFDVATTLLPQEVTQILEKEKIRVIPTGIDHGTVTAILGEYKFEITTLRKDKETDGRHAVVDYTQDWIEDAKRRDFTMNTLLMDVKGNVYDPLGSGLKDIDAREVVFVGVADTRIEEDHLRILRFFRFSSIYAKDFNQDGLEACKKHAKSIASLSKERITQEFFKIIMADKPADVLDVMFQNGVLDVFNFQEFDKDFLNAFCKFQKDYRLSALSSRLFVMAGMNLDNIKKMSAFILFPKVFIKDMRFIDAALGQGDLCNDQAVKACVYMFGRSQTAQTLLVELVQDRVVNRYAPTALELIQNWDVPNLPVSGDDVMRAGVVKGPKVGEMLDALEGYWIDSGFAATREECLNQI